MIRQSRSCTTLQASPEFKGIKTSSVFANAFQGVGFKPALNSKGLRLFELAYFLWRCGFKPALNSKGLRPNKIPGDINSPRLQASPEFKGIKTLN